MDDVVATNPEPGASRRLRRAITWPLRRFFDPRFYGVSAVVEQGAEAVTSVVGGQTEVLSFMRAELARIGDEIEGLQRRTNSIDDAALLKALMASGINELSDDLATFLNFVESHEGLRAQRGLWFNEALSFRYVPGGVELGSVNERIAEVPYAFRALGTVPIGARVLDVGACESTVAFALASLGFKVTALDLREYPLKHPNLTVVASPLDQAHLARGTFDIVFCISSIEHFGLSSYGTSVRADDADRAALATIRGLLKPGGSVVLTVPFGLADVDEFQRTYDSAGLDDLLTGWSVSEKLVLQQSEPAIWRPIDEVNLTPEAGRRYVALVTAEPAVR